MNRVGTLTLGDDVKGIPPDRAVDLHRIIGKMDGTDCPGLMYEPYRDFHEFHGKPIGILDEEEQGNGTFRLHPARRIEKNFWKGRIHKAWHEARPVMNFRVGKHRIAKLQDNLDGSHPA